MRVAFYLLCLILAAAPFAARAQRAPVVLELYTSQGCATCPPADALLAELATLEGVIALSLHVDYWDYLGWTDSFGAPAHTKRQRGYAKARHQRSVFTPQMVVQGEDVLIGHNAPKILASIAAHQAEPAPVALRVERDKGGLRIDLKPLGAAVGPSLVYLVEFVPSATVAVTGGENAGQDIRYTNVVTDWSTVGRWDGEAEVEIEVPDVAPEPLAVIVQREHLGPILSAARLD